MTILVFMTANTLTENISLLKVRCVSQADYACGSGKNLCTQIGLLLFEEGIFFIEYNVSGT